MNIEKIQFSSDITVFQLRAARAALKISLKKLADISGLSEGALIKLEAGDIYSRPQHSSFLTVGKVRAVLEEMGIEFYHNNFIRLVPKEEQFVIRVVSK